MSQPATSTGARRDVGGLVTGLLAIAMGVGVIVYASGMPEIRPGIPGPGLFPMLIGGLMILFGLPLGLLSWFRTTPSATDRVDRAEGADESALAETVGTTAGPLATSGRSALINGFAFIGAIVCYIVLAEILGFVLTLSIITIGLMLLLRVKPLHAVIVGVLTSLALWALFERMLLVQLPNGFLGVF